MNFINKCAVFDVKWHRYIEPSFLYPNLGNETCRCWHKVYLFNVYELTANIAADGKYSHPMITFRQ